MASVIYLPSGYIASTPEDVPGKPRTVGSHLIDAGAQMLQSFTPVKQFQQVFDFLIFLLLIS